MREIDPYIERAKNDNVKIKYIFETHFHADFVSGHIDLAKATGGSIHTMEEDLTELSALNEGEILKILGKKYIIEKGKFKML